MEFVCRAYREDPIQPVGQVDALRGQAHGALRVLAAAVAGLRVWFREELLVGLREGACCPSPLAQGAEKGGRSAVAGQNDRW